MLKKIKISDIDLSQDGNIREELGDIDGLADSIKKRGLIYPIKVRTGTIKSYEVIDGFRRMQALLKLGVDEISADDLGEISDDERDFIQYVANEQSKYNTWWEKAQFYKRKIDEGFTQEKIAKEINQTRSAIANYLQAYRLFDIDSRLSKELNSEIAREISYAPKDDWEILMKDAVEIKATRQVIRKIVQNCATMKNKLDLIEITHPVVHKMLNDFWYPLRYQIGSSNDMIEESDLRMGNPHRTDRYFDADEITEEEARSKAEEQHGEFRGLKIFRRYIIYGLKRTARQIREKWT